jgi:hypothetical protein
MGDFFGITLDDLFSMCERIRIPEKIDRIFETCAYGVFEHVHIHVQGNTKQ